MIRCPFCKRWAEDESGVVDHDPLCPEPETPHPQPKGH